MTRNHEILLIELIGTHVEARLLDVVEATLLCLTALE